MALEWRTPNRHTKTKDENLLSSSTPELYTKVLANGRGMQLQPVYQTQWIQRERTQTHTHTMSSREKLHSLFSISFFANISQQFMLFFFFLSTFGLLFFSTKSFIFIFRVHYNIQESWS